jgi:hypothetical protein
MQEWSGPGPFHEGAVPLDATFCTKMYSQTDEDAQTHAPCWFVDFRRLVTSDDDNFPVKVKTYFVDVGPSVRLRRSVEVGVGAGLMWATGNKTAYRLTFVTPRIVIKPALFVAGLFSSEADRSRWLHVVKFYIRGNFIGGRLTGDDLGVSGTSYDRTFEYVVSRGFLVDLIELLQPREKWTNIR